MNAVPADTARTTNEQLTRHVSGFWPKWTAFSWEHGEIMQRLPEFRVLRVPPFAAGEPWIYVTVGAWEAARDGSEQVEFLLLAPAEDPYHVETLAAVTMRQFEPELTARVGRVVPIGRPWTKGAAADHFLVTLPYPFGPEFERCDSASGLVRFLWLVPIAKEEAEYVREHGVDAFEDLAEDADVEFADPNRPSLVCDCDAGGINAIGLSGR